MQILRQTNRALLTIEDSPIFPCFIANQLLDSTIFKELRKFYFALHYVLGLSFLSYSKQEGWWKMLTVFRQQK